MEVYTKSPEETAHQAGQYLKGLAPKQGTATVVGLSGDLGSGKTTFTQALARHLGVQETVTSPTFVIEKIYQLPNGQPFKHLIHIDAYRLSDGRELLNLGWAEIVSDPGNLILVEWSERVQDILPENSLEIQFQFIDEQTRLIKY
jgi:tRNA threonylcarbamoyladenosine biosynthesis protein TsaE